MIDKKITLIIFDWDGTLIDSAAHISDCLLSSIAELPLEPRTAQQVNDMIGLSLDAAIAGLYPTISSKTHDQLAGLFRKKIMLVGTKPSPLFPFAAHVLAQLKSAGYNLAVATGNSRAGLDRAMNETGLTEYFPVTRCADETFSKPHPQMLEEIITDYNIKAGEALMIGDSEYDLQMANNIKMPALAVSYGVHKRERLLAHKPVAIKDDLQAVADFILAGAKVS